MVTDGLLTMQPVCHGAGMPRRPLVDRLTSAGDGQLSQRSSRTGLGVGSARTLAQDPDQSLPCCLQCPAVSCALLVLAVQLDLHRGTQKTRSGDGDGGVARCVLAQSGCHAGADAAVASAYYGDGY